MARFWDFNGATQATAASTTVTFTPRDIPGTGVVAYIFRFTGAGMTVGDLTRIRIKAGGTPIWDVAFAHLQAWQQRFFSSNLAAAAADTVLVVPCNLPDEYANLVGAQRGLFGEDAADLCQFPVGQAPTIELVIGAGGAAGTVAVGWCITNVPPLFYSSLYSSALQIAASSTNARYPISEGGLIRGVGLNTTGLTRGRVVLAGTQRVNLEGTELWNASQRDRNVATVTDPGFVKIVGEQQGPAGSSFFELDTAAGWAGAANEGSIFAIRPIAG